MLVISQRVTIPESELEFSAIRASGAGGQHVNKVSSAIHLRFDIKAQQYRSQDKNREDALNRLAQLIKAATALRKTRRATKSTKGPKGDAWIVRPNADR